MNLYAFTQQYAETALWSSVGEDGAPLDDNYDIADLAPETLDKMVADCADFKTAAGGLLDDIEDSQAAHDFWLTRNRHGVGFWDRDLGEIGDKLTTIAQAYGETDLYVGDDGRLYLS